MPLKAFFIGGPGTLSTSAIEILAGRGEQVAVFSHSSRCAAELPLQVQIYPGERDDTPALQAALEDFRPDAVLDFIGYTPDQCAALLPLLEGKLGQYIFVSTVDVYGYPLSRLPFREDDPWHPETQSPYAENKRGCEALLRARFHPVRLPLTIARPAYSFGPGFILSFMARDQGLPMLARLRAGLPVMVPGDGTTLMHVSAAPNTGAMIAALVGAPAAIGKDYTCGHPTFTTHDGYIRLFARALDVNPRIVHIPSDTIAAIDLPEIRDCLLHALTRFNVAFSIDRFLRDFPEFRWQTTLDEWAGSVVETIRDQLDAAAAVPLLDDRIIAAFQRRAAMML